MAVKTITIDMESYTLLASRKRSGESSNSQRERINVEFLLEHLRIIYPDTGFAVSYGEIYGYLSRNTLV